MSADELADTPLWLHGPNWPLNGEELPEEPAGTVSVQKNADVR